MDFGLGDETCVPPQSLRDLRGKRSAGRRLGAPEQRASRPVSRVRAEPTSESPGGLVADRCSVTDSAGPGGA